MSKINQAYDFICEKIQQGAFKPGFLLKERDIAKELDISRTPVREAFRRLEENGIVTFIPYRGVSISNYSREEIIQLYRVRIALEVLAAEICAEQENEELINRLEEVLGLAEIATAERNILEIRNVNRKFHNSIIEFTKNPFLINKLRDLQAKIDLCMMRSLSNTGRPSYTLEEHKLITWALKNKNKQLAEQLVRFHIEKSLDNVLLNYS